MKKQRLLVLAMGLVLFASGCMGSFMPAVRPDVETVRLNVVVSDEAQDLIASVSDDMTVQTGTLIATSANATVVEKAIVYNNNKSNLSVKLPEGVWEMTLTASSDQRRVLYSGVVKGIEVIVGQMETHTVELGLATGDLDVRVDLAGLDQGYHSPRLTLISPYKSIPNQVQPIAALSNDTGTVVFKDVPVGPWRAALSAEIPGSGTLEIMSANSVSPLGTESIMVNVSVPIYAEFGILDMTISKWGNPPPKRPVSIRVEQRTNDRVRVEWDAPEDQVKGSMQYAVYRKIAQANDPSYFQEMRGTTSGTGYSDEDDAGDVYIDFGSRHGLTYTYWVQTYYVNEEGYFSSRLSEPTEIRLSIIDEEIEDPDLDPDPDPVPVDPGDEVDVVDGMIVSVANTAQLQDALGNLDVGKIVFTESITSNITINKSLIIDFKDKTLTGNVAIDTNAGTVRLLGNDTTPPDYHIDGTLTVAEGNTVENYARIKGASPGIFITGASEFVEGASGNEINVKASEVIVTILDGAIVAKITVDGDLGNVQIENNGIVMSVENNGTETMWTGGQPESYSGVVDQENSQVTVQNNEDGTNTITLIVRDEYESAITSFVEWTDPWDGSWSSTKIELKFAENIGDATGGQWYTLTAIGDVAFNPPGPGLDDISISRITAGAGMMDRGVYTVTIASANITTTVDVKVDGVEIATNVIFVITGDD